MTINYKKLPHHGIRSLTPYAPGKSSEDLQEEKNITDVIKIASNENPLGCSPRVVAALQQLSPLTIATYPRHSHPLRSQLADQLNIAPEQLILGNGSDSFFSLLMTCFALHNNQHILTHEQAFSAYAIQAQTLGIPVCTVPVNEWWGLEVDKLITACNKHTGLIFLANPNNPTGLLIPAHDIIRLLDNIPASTLIVIDEAYYEYAASTFAFNLISVLSRYPNLIITRTFSKIYGFAGLRLGYLIAHPDIVSLLQTIQLPFAVNQAALYAGAAALEDKLFINKSLENNVIGKKLLETELSSLGLPHLPSATNFITFDCKEDSNKLYNYLLTQGIIVRTLHPYKMNSFLRVTIGTPEQNLRFLQALKTYLQYN